MSLHDAIVGLLREPPQAPTLTGLTPSEQVFAHLVQTARTEARAGSPPDLRAWIEADDDDERAAAEVDQSLAAAEILEGWIDQLPARAERLAAAGTDRREAGRPPFPATFEGGGWTLTIGLEEQGRLYLAVDAAPSAEAVEVVLDGVDEVFAVAGRAGAAILLGTPDEVLGAPAEFNPWSVLVIHTAGGSLELRRVP